MKREPRTLIEVCPTCRRDGWKRREQFALWTQEEFTHHPPSPVRGAPPDAELVHVVPGATINDAVAEALDLAFRLGKPIAFTFNGYPIVVRSDSDPIAILKAWGEHFRPTGRKDGEG